MSAFFFPRHIFFNKFAIRFTLVTIIAGFAKVAVISAEPFPFWY
jgi:hypothetical protein